MRLQINEHWSIDWDGQCYTLFHATVITGEGKGAKKTKAENIGKMRENFAGYYGRNLKLALMAYTTKAALEGDGTIDVASLLYKLDQIEATIVAFLAKTPLPAETIRPAPAGPPPKVVTEPVGDPQPPAPPQAFDVTSL